MAWSCAVVKQSERASVCVCVWLQSNGNAFTELCKCCASHLRYLNHEDEFEIWSILYGETHKNQKQQRHRKWMSVIIIIVIILPLFQCLRFGVVSVEHFDKFHIRMPKFIFYINGVERGAHTNSTTATSTTDMYTLHSAQLHGKDIFISRWMRRPFNPERKFMAYRQCHIWKIIHKICLIAQASRSLWS